MVSFTNLAPNPLFTGGTTGNLGSGGAWPTGCVHQNNGAGDSAWENQGVTTTGGLTTLRFRLSFTNTSGGDAYPNLFYGDCSVSANTVYQAPLRARIVSYSASGSVYFVWQGAVENNISGSYLVNNTGLLNLSASWQYSAAAVKTSASTAELAPYIGVGMANGASIDMVVEIAAPMCIQGDWAPPFFGSATTWPYTRTDLVADFVTSGSSYSVPGGWTDDNSVEVLGSGGAGVAANNNTSGQKRGGGGGGYSRGYRLSATPGGSISVQVGTAGGANDSWWDSAATLMAKRGANATTSTAGAGGAAAGGVGEIRFSGGSGGAPSSTGGGGGGGAAGPNGDGRTGGATSGAGGGGGAGAAGRLSANGSAGTASGGAGGAGPNGTGGGSSPAGAGSDGGGGGGATSGNGGTGGQHACWTKSSDSSTRGPGGGGGGASNTTNAVGGAGGGHGSGGGGGKLTGGAAKDGLIFVAFWPALVTSRSFGLILG
jgi:hypothetical protein